MEMWQVIPELHKVLDQEHKLTSTNVENDAHTYTHTRTRTHTQTHTHTHTHVPLTKVSLPTRQGIIPRKAPEEAEIRAGHYT